MSTEGTKTIKGRISNKHGTEEYWILSVYTDLTKTTLRENPFIPLPGEIIIYDPDDVYDYPRFKFGDKHTDERERRNVVDLPFVTEEALRKAELDINTVDKTVAGAINEICEELYTDEIGEKLVKNLTNTTWQFNSIPYFTTTKTFNVDLVYNYDVYENLIGHTLKFTYENGQTYISCDENTLWHIDFWWGPDEVRTFSISGGSDVENKELIDLLYNTATVKSGAPTGFISKIEKCFEETTTCLEETNEINKKLFTAYTENIIMGTTLLLNNTIDVSGANGSALEFTSGDLTFNSIEYMDNYLRYYLPDNTQITAYENGQWTDEKWRTITLVNAQHGLGSFTDWFAENAKIIYLNLDEWLTKKNEHNCFYLELSQDKTHYIVSATCDHEVLDIPSEHNGLPVTKISMINSHTIHTINVPDSIQEIYSYAFMNASKLKNLLIPKTVTTVGYSIVSTQVGHDLTVYCEADEKPTGWDDGWNDDIPVVWGIPSSFIAVGKKLNGITTDVEKLSSQFDTLVELGDAAKSWALNEELEALEDFETHYFDFYATLEGDNTKRLYKGIQRSGFGAPGATGLCFIGEDDSPVVYIFENSTDGAAERGWNAPLVDNVIAIVDTPDEVVMSWLKNNATPVARLSDYQTKHDDTLTTTDKTITGAINELDSKRLDKAEYISIANTYYVDYDSSEGIYIDGLFYATKDEGDTDVMEVNLHRHIPFVEGDNIKFSTEGNIVKINALGGIKYSKGLVYTISDDETYFVCTGIGTCTDLDIVIPPTHEGLPVMAIGELAFQGENITSVIIPEGIQYIQTGAFSLCPNLKKVVIPGSVSEIGYGTFNDCNNLTDIQWSHNNEEEFIIEDYAFAKCGSLKTLVIPHGVTYLSECCFQNTAIDQVVIPTSLERFEHDALLASKIYYAGTREQWNSIDFVGSSESLNESTIYYNYADTPIEINEKIENIIPSYNPDTDNGKFLRLVDGKPAWEPISIAEEAEF